MYAYTHVCMYVYICYDLVVMYIGITIKDRLQIIRLLQFCMNLPCMKYINRPDMSHIDLYKAHRS